MITPTRIKKGHPSPVHYRAPPCFRIGTRNLSKFGLEARVGRTSFWVTSKAVKKAELWCCTRNERRRRHELHELARRGTPLPVPSPLRKGRGGFVFVVGLTRLARCAVTLGWYDETPAGF